MMLHNEALLDKKGQNSNSNKNNHGGGHHHSSVIAKYFLGKCFFWEHTNVIIPWLSVQQIKTIVVLADEKEEKRKN